MTTPLLTMKLHVPPILDENGNDPVCFRSHLLAAEQSIDPDLDQAAVYSLVAKLRDLGLPLLAVNYVEMES
jgi:hypothetical protein